MGKNALAAMSLVAAVPAAAVLVFVIMALLRHTQNMTGVLVAVNAVALLTAALLALMPAFVFFRIPPFRGAATENEEPAGEVADTGAAPVAAAASSAAVTAEILADDDGDEVAGEDVGFESEAAEAETGDYKFSPDELEDADVEPADDAFEFDEDDELK